MNINIEYKRNDIKKIERVRIDGEKTCEFGRFKQAIDVTIDKKEIRILDIDHATSMWMNKNELSRYINLLQRIHEQMEV